MSQPALLDNLVTRHGYPLLDLAGADAFLMDDDVQVLLFAGDPVKHPEALDLAVILPEVMRHFSTAAAGPPSSHQRPKRPSSGASASAFGQPWSSCAAAST